MSSENDSSHAKGPFLCRLCPVTFSYRKTLTRHLRNKHSIDGKPFECLHCKARFNDKWALGKHIGSTHLRKHHVVICPICRYKDSKIMFDIHFSEAHDIKVENEYFKFDNMEEFDEWKGKIEKTTVARFVVNQKFEKKNGAKRIIYNCHRSGFFKPRGKNKRKIKTQGTNKIMGFCPARLEFEAIDDGTIAVQFFKTHVGHDNDVHKVFSQCEMKSLSKKRRKKVDKRRTKDVAVQSNFPEDLDSSNKLEVNRIPVELINCCQIVTNNDADDMSGLLGIKPILLGEFAFNNNVITIFRTTTTTVIDQPLDICNRQDESDEILRDINTITAIDLNGDVVGVVDVNMLPSPSPDLDELEDIEMSDSPELPCDAFASLDLSKYLSSRLSILPDTMATESDRHVADDDDDIAGFPSLDDKLLDDPSLDIDVIPATLTRDKEMIIDRFRKLVDAASTPSILWEIDKICSPAFELVESFLEHSIFSDFKKADK